MLNLLRNALAAALVLFAYGSVARSEEGRSLALSPQGTLLLSASKIDPIGNPVLKLWDTSTGQLVRTFPDFQGDDVLAAFSNDGERAILVYSNRDGGRIQTWSTVSWKLEKELKFGISAATALSYATGAKRFAFGTQRGAIQASDESSRAIEFRQPNLLCEKITALAVSASGHFVLAGGTRFDCSVATLHLWDLRNPHQSFDLFDDSADEKRSILAVALSQGGRQAMVATNFGIFAWDFESRKRLRRIVELNYDDVQVLAFSSDERHLLYGAACEVNWISIATGQKRRVWQGCSSAVAVSQDRKRIATQKLDGSEINLVDAETGRLLRTIKP